MIRKIAYVFVGALVICVFLLPIFIKVKIECQSQFGRCPSEIVAQLESFGGKSLIQARSGLSKSLKKNLLVTDFSMQYKIPNILEVNLLLKKPDFAILDRATGKYGLIDKDGRIILVLSNSSLPTVAVSGKNLQVGSIVSSQELFALKLIQGIWQMYQVGLGEIQEDSLVVELPGPIKVILPQDGDKDVLLGEVRLVYGKVESPETAGKYSEIDLRFKNPVLR